jgi:hypothetical protein
MDSSTGSREPSIIIPQTAPGTYTLSLPAPAAPSLATIAIEGRTIARHAIAGRYAREFYPVGNDRAAMHTLAARTGGEVNEPSDDRPIDFHWPRRTLPLAPWLAALGVVLLAGALIHWRRG